MAEYVTPDPDDEQTYEAALAEARADGVDRHALPSATRYDGPGSGKVAAALHGHWVTCARCDDRSIDLDGPEPMCPECRVADVAEPAPAPVGRARAQLWPLLALSASVAVQIAQSATEQPAALTGLSEPVTHGVLSVAQLVVVLAAIYRMGPATPQK